MTPLRRTRIRTRKNPQRTTPRTLSETAGYNICTRKRQDPYIYRESKIHPRTHSRVPPDLHPQCYMGSDGIVRYHSRVSTEHGALIRTGSRYTDARSHAGRASRGSGYQGSGDTQTIGKIKKSFDIWSTSHIIRGLFKFG